MRSVVAVGCALAALFLARETVAQGLLPGERETNVVAIPGVVSAGAKWQIVWADFKTADGIVGTPDRGVIFAQEQSDSVKTDPSGPKLLPYIE